MDDLNKMRKKMFTDMGVPGLYTPYPEFTKEELVRVAPAIPDKDKLLEALKRYDKKK